MITVTIDGPAGSGKGTIGKYIAERFNLRYLDTGLLYRAVGLFVFERQILTNQLDAILEITPLAINQLLENSLPNKDLRSEVIGEIASQIATLPALRTYLNTIQRDFASKIEPPYQGVILDGRDIGTVVLPNALIKFFLTADLETRIKRRLEQFERMEEELKEKFVNLETRDKRDQNREQAPLIPAKDAIVIDTTYLSLEEVKTLCEKYISEKIDTSRNV